MRASQRKLAATLALLAFASCAQNRPIACNHFPNMEPATCELTSAGVIVVAKPSLANISFGPEGLGAIIVENRDLYFVTRKGKTAPALKFDNGPDNVVEGLARTVRNGKVGFVNTDLDPVVATVWDFASPFDHGVAVVCTGCVPTPAFPGDEHRAMTGGKWGYIDKHGRVVVPVVHDAGSLPPVEFAEKQAIQ